MIPFTWIRNKVYSVGFIELLVLISQLCDISLMVKYLTKNISRSKSLSIKSLKTRNTQKIVENERSYGTNGTNWSLEHVLRDWFRFDAVESIKNTQTTSTFSNHTIVWYTLVSQLYAYMNVWVCFCFGENIHFHTLSRQETSCKYSTNTNALAQVNIRLIQYIYVHNTCKHFVYMWTRRDTALTRQIAQMNQYWMETVSIFLSFFLSKWTFL